MTPQGWGINCVPSSCDVLHPNPGAYYRECISYTHTKAKPHRQAGSLFRIIKTFSIWTWLYVWLLWLNSELEMVIWFNFMALDSTALDSLIESFLLTF
jgi:hypothetical protein